MLVEVAARRAHQLLYIQVDALTLGVGQLLVERDVAGRVSRLVLVHQQYRDALDDGVTVPFGADDCAVSFLQRQLIAWTVAHLVSTVPIIS